MCNRNRKRILIITHIRQLWSSNRSGSTYAINSLIDSLRKNYDVDVYCTKYVMKRSKNGPRLYMGQSFFSYFFEVLCRKLQVFLKYSKPPRNILYDDKEMQSLKERQNFRVFLKSRHYDLYVIEYLHNHHLMKEIDDPKSKVIIDTHDVLNKRLASLPKVGSDEGNVITEEQEVSSLSLYDKVLAIQEREFSYFEEKLPGSVILAKRPSLIRDVSFPELKPGPLVLAFVGSTSLHNVVGINWFIENVWDFEVNSLFKLKVFGNVCSKISLPNLDVYNNISLCGNVDSLDFIYEPCHLVINPVLLGSGLKIKNIEALGFGRLVLTTSVGAEGMEECIDSSIFVADSAVDYKKKLKDFYRNKEFLYERSSRAHKDAKLYFSDDRCFSEIKKYINEI